MSRFLKFIIHLVIVLIILDVVALAVPPFMGITTAIIDGSEQGTNLPTGSVTYARSVPVDELQAGDMILVEDNNSVYKYKINAIDTSSNVYNVYDQTDVDEGEISITLSGTEPEVIVTVPIIGYLIVATQSTEGLIVIALVIILLIVLFILSELWRKDQPEQKEPAIEEETLSDRQSEKQRRAELKQREKDETQYDKKKAREEYREIKNEDKEQRKEEKRRRKEEKKHARVGGFVEDYDPIETQSQGKPVLSEEETATDEANQFLKKEVVAATVASSEESPADQLTAKQDISSRAVADEAKAAQEESATMPEPAENAQIDVPLEAASEATGDLTGENAAAEMTETTAEAAGIAAEEAETAAEMAETAEMAEAAETSEMAEAFETSETAETLEAAEMAEASETAETAEATEMSENVETAVPSEDVQDDETAAIDQSEQEMAADEVEESEIEQSEPEEEPVVYEKMAIPVYTEAELLEQARIAGEDPKVIRDEQLGITLLDYTRIIAEDASQQTDEKDS